MPVYKIVSSCAELSQNSLFTITGSTVETGALILAMVNDYLIVGRWFPLVAGFDWILQPSRIIRLTGRVIVKIIGVIAPFEPFAAEWGRHFS